MYVRRRRIVAIDAELWRADGERRRLPRFTVPGIVPNVLRFAPWLAGGVRCSISFSRPRLIEIA